MQLDELLTIVQGSSPQDWHKREFFTLHGWTTFADEHVEPTYHHSLAIFRPDVDISIVYGATVNEDFAESWANDAFSGSASSFLVWLRYRGAVVYEWVFVSVDGGRYALPLPDRLESDRFRLPHDRMPLAKLIFELSKTASVGETLDAVLARAQIETA